MRRHDYSVLRWTVIAKDDWLKLGCDSTAVTHILPILLAPWSSSSSREGCSRSLPCGNGPLWSHLSGGGDSLLFAHYSHLFVAVNVAVLCVTVSHDFSAIDVSVLVLHIATNRPTFDVSVL